MIEETINFFKDKAAQRGIGVFAMMGLAFLFFIAIPIILFALSDISKIMFQVIMAFMIIAYVRNFGVEGPLMWLLSGILIYFLVWKYPLLTAELYMFMIMVGMGFTSAIMWGSSTVRGLLAGKKDKKKQEMQKLLDKSKKEK